MLGAELPDNLHREVAAGKLRKRWLANQISIMNRLSRCQGLLEGIKAQAPKGYEDSLEVIIDELKQALEGY